MLCVVCGVLMFVRCALIQVVDVGLCLSCAVCPLFDGCFLVLLVIAVMHCLLCGGCWLCLDLIVRCLLFAVVCYVLVIACVVCYCVRGLLRVDVCSCVLFVACWCSWFACCRVFIVCCSLSVVCCC